MNDYEDNEDRPVRFRHVLDGIQLKESDGKDHKYERTITPPWDDRIEDLLVPDEGDLTISMPLFCIKTRKTKKDLKLIFNLNNFRNWHFQVQNFAKQWYTATATPKLRDFKVPDGRPISLTLTLYKASRRVCDRANVLCMHEKMVCDAMQKAGCIVDDNDKYIHSTHYLGGGMDRDNPRVEIRIDVV